MKKCISALLIVLMLFLTGCNLEPLTEEERAAIEASRTHEYKVVSVYQYVKTYTNQFGAVTSQKLVYAFTYIGDDGQLHQVDTFYHLEHGLWKVKLGNENKYVVYENFDTYETLYLTEETLNNIPTK